MTNPFALDTPPAPAAAPAAPAAPVQPTPAPVAAPAGLPAPATDDPFGAPAPQLPKGPRLREMYGRLLLFVPYKVELNVPNTIEPGKFQDRMTADVIILHGGPCAYGGTPEKTGGKPHDMTAQIPHKNARMYISAPGLISQCREALQKRAQGQPGMVLGRLTTGTPPTGGGNPPWILTPANDADRQIGRAYLAQVDPFA